jgi:hypothetical protein
MPIFSGTMINVSWTDRRAQRHDTEETLRLFTLTPNDGKAALGAFRRGLTVALHDLRANAVCVNELGLPNVGGKAMPAAKHIARMSSQQYKALVVAGTSHDMSTFLNTGYVFSPDGPAAGYPFYKHTTDRNFGEAVMAPASRTILAATVSGFRVAVIVGLDVTDHACISALVQLKDEIDILLVPCYTTRIEKLADVARVVSLAIAGVVVLVNGAWPEVPHYYVARFGQTGLMTEERALPSGGVVSLLEMEQASFRSERARCHADPDENMDWLFAP